MSDWYYQQHLAAMGMSQQQQLAKDSFRYGFTPIGIGEGMTMPDKPQFYECYAILDPKPDDKDGKSRVLIDHCVAFYDSRKDAQTDLECDAYDFLRAKFNPFSARRKLQRVRYVVRAITNG